MTFKILKGKKLKHFKHFKHILYAPEFGAHESRYTFFFFEKAMRLAFFQLTNTLREKGVTDEEKLKRKLETYGIFVDSK